MTSHHVSIHTKKETTMPGPRSHAHISTSLPAFDLERARLLPRQARARAGRGANLRPARARGGACMARSLSVVWHPPRW